MSEIMGGVTSTPIAIDAIKENITDQTYNPNSENAISGKAVKEAISNKPTIFEGTKINSFDASMTGGIVGKKEFAFGGNTVGDFWLNLKVGDLYYNTDEEKTYICLSVFVSDDKSSADSTWKDLNVKPDAIYDSTSLNAQSGKAVAEAIGKNTAEIDEAINNGDTYTLNTANAYTDNKVGDIEIALDSIIAIQNSLIGGDA